MKNRSPGHGGAGHGKLRGAVAVAATYVYFLLFAQFAFLDLVQRRFADPAQVKAVMAVMGVAGVAVSLATAWALGRTSPRRLLLAGFSGCGVSALLALWAAGSVAGLPGFMALGGLIGAATAVLTVSLASSLGSLLGGSDPGGSMSRRHFATWVGLGTGLAYLVCNLPPLFEGSVALRGIFAAATCAIGLVAVWRMPSSPGRRSAVAGDRAPRYDSRDYRGIGFVTIVLSFVALIWLDSAAFAIIQETASLKMATWGSGGQKLAIGVFHLLGAVAAGRLIDRGYFRSLLVATFALFAIAFSWLEPGAGSVGLAPALYAVGIAVYSTALVAFPALRGDRGGVVPIRWRAGLLFGVAGWLGSALGVGMAQSLHRIPALFVWLAGSLLILSWALANLAGTRPFGLVVRGARLFGWAVVLGLVPFLVAKTGHDRSALRGETEARARGRAVYIREGCINCHSQYVRPRSRDVELWGPYRAVDSAEQPPLLGNRRLGPDLRNVGNRRSSSWQRLHLEKPRALVPNSRMPSYARLFTPRPGQRGPGEKGRTDGDDLVAYLSGLGLETARQRYETTLALEMRQPPRAVSAHQGRLVFDEYCLPCHGSDARGSGPLAAAVYKERSAIDLTKGDFWLVPWGAGQASDQRALARVVKFGIPNTSMPGHEYLSKQQVADVVAFVQAVTEEISVAESGPSLPDARSAAAAGAAG